MEIRKTFFWKKNVFIFDQDRKIIDLYNIFKESDIENKEIETPIKKNGKNYQKLLLVSIFIICIIGILFILYTKKLLLKAIRKNRKYLFELFSN